MVGLYSYGSVCKSFGVFGRKWSMELVDTIKEKVVTLTAYVLNIDA